LVAFFVEAEDIQGAIIALDFEVTVIGSEPLIERFEDTDLTFAAIEPSGLHCPEIVDGLLNSNAHERVSADGAAPLFLGSIGKKSNSCRNTQFAPSGQARSIRSRNQKPIYRNAPRDAVDSEGKRRDGD
jgi:hypothetical protein